MRPLPILVLLLIGCNRGSEIKLPDAEIALIRAVATSTSDYRAANDLKRPTLRGVRRDSLKAALRGNLHADGWYGHIAELSTDSDGNAIVEIQLPAQPYVITIETHHGAASDEQTHTLIPKSSPLFMKLAEMNKGDAVRFSCDLFPDDTDYISERSLTERGSMEKPEFVARFGDISTIR